MLNKTIGICIVVIFGNAFGMKLSSGYADLASVMGSRLTASVAVSASAASTAIR